MEKTLVILQNTDPETQEHDSQVLLKDEGIVVALLLSKQGRYCSHGILEK